MNDRDYYELREMTAGAKRVLLEGKLEPWQTSDAAAFHIFGSAILDIHERLQRIEGPVGTLEDTNQSLGDAENNEPSSDKGQPSEND